MSHRNTQKRLILIQLSLECFSGLKAVRICVRISLVHNPHGIINSVFRRQIRKCMSILGVFASFELRAKNATYRGVWFGIFKY
jgi:hypothetical protein